MESGCWFSHCSWIPGGSGGFGEAPPCPPGSGPWEQTPPVAAHSSPWVLSRASVFCYKWMLHRYSPAYRIVINCAPLIAAQKFQMLGMALGSMRGQEKMKCGCMQIFICWGVRKLQQKVRKFTGITQSKCLAQKTNRWSWSKPLTSSDALSPTLVSVSAEEIDPQICTPQTLHSS